MLNRAVIYIRVSDPSQVDNNSLENQEAICRKHAASLNLEVVQVFREEGVSAKHVRTRVKLMELLAYSTKKSNNISSVLIYKLDRFSRNLEDGLAAISLLAKANVLLISATEPIEDSPIGRAIRNIMMTVGQLDNEMKGVVVKSNMLASFKKGLWPFKPPVGYKRKFSTKEQNKGLAPIQHPEIAPILSRMFHNAATGIFSKAQLARMMNLEGFAEHYGIPATHKSVGVILGKSFYYGKMYAPKWKEYAQGLHMPLTDENTWTQAYQRLILKKRAHRYHDVAKFPLKGSISCETCGHLMTTSPSQGHNSTVDYYECKNRLCTKQLRINTTKAHAQFKDLLVNIKPSTRVIALFNHMVFSEWEKVIQETESRVEDFDTRIQKMRQELKSIRGARDEGIYTVDEAKDEAERIRRDITVLEMEKSDIQIEHYDSESTRLFTEQFLSHLDLLWDHLDLAKRQALLQKIFVGGLVCTKERNIRTTQLSGSFNLIEALSTQNDQNVSPPGIGPGFKV